MWLAKGGAKDESAFMLHDLFQPLRVSGVLRGAMWSDPERKPRCTEIVTEQFVVLNAVKDPHLATAEVQVLRCAQDDRWLSISLLRFPTKHI